MRLDLLASLSSVFCLINGIVAIPRWEFDIKGSYLSNIKLATEDSIIPMVYYNQRLLRVIPAGCRRHAKNLDAEKTVDHYKRDDDYSLLQTFNLKPEVTLEELFGPKKCPIHTLDISSNPCEFDSFSCNSSSSSSSTCSSSSTSSTSSSCSSTPSSSSSSSSTTIDLGTRLTASCHRQVGVYSYPELKNSCHYDKEGVVNVRVADSGRSYILYKNSLVIMDCKCEVVKTIKHFYFNNEVFEGVDLLVNEYDGYMILGLSRMYLVVYRLCDFNVIYEGFFYSCDEKAANGQTQTTISTSAAFRFADSALRINNQSWNIYIISETTAWILVRIPLPWAENPEGGATFCPLFEILYESTDAGCSFDTSNPAVINDYMNDMDIMVTQDGNLLNFLVIEYECEAKIVYGSCSTTQLPDCVSGNLVKLNGIKLPYCNQLFFSFVPSLDMVTLGYHVNNKKSTTLKGN